MTTARRTVGTVDVPRGTPIALTITATDAGRGEWAVHVEVAAAATTNDTALPDLYAPDEVWAPGSPRASPRARRFGGPRRMPLALAAVAVVAVAFLAVGPGSAKPATSEPPAPTALPAAPGGDCRLRPGGCTTAEGQFPPSASWAPDADAQGP